MTYHYHQVNGGDEQWQAIPENKLDTVANSMFVTILGVDSPVAPEATKEELASIKYKGPLYFDLDDAESPASTATHAVRLIKKLEELGVLPSMLHIYASGGKGFHILVPEACFLTKPPKTGLPLLPAIYKEMAFNLAVDSLDLRVYTARKGRMLRQQNVKRPNGQYKVAMLFEELESIAELSDKDEAEELYRQITGAPRTEQPRTSAELAMGLLALFDQCKSRVTKAAATRKKVKPVVLPDNLPSFDALLRGDGIKEGVGFHPIAMQIAITAHARGMDKATLLEAAAGLCENHNSDGTRYNTASKRRAELGRMWEYTEDNPCYVYNSGAIAGLLTHSAPDLRGLEVSDEEVLAGIHNPDDGVSLDDPYEHAGVTLTARGAYTMTENGPKRILALGFENITELVSATSNTLAVIEADVNMAGKPLGRKVMSLDSFASVNNFNKITMPYGQSFNGSEAQARGMLMRFSEKARKTGNRMYVLSREGLDIVSMPFHEDEEVRKDFLVWSDVKNVTPQPSILTKAVKLKFVGFPDENGQFRTDLSLAPSLPAWLKEAGNTELLQGVLRNLLYCQKPAYLGKLIGWMVACHYRMLFHKIYDKFPLLHINGSAGAGKCLGVDTPVLMYDGSIKKVQDVVVGDKLLGPDGGVRNVLSLARGQEMLYRVKQYVKDDYVVNQSHILSLIQPAYLDEFRNEKRKGTGVQKVVNLSVKEYFSLGKVAADYYGWSVPKILHGDTSVSLNAIKVEKLDIGDYYGFEIDGDKLFLLGDFTVTHNTEMSMLMCNFHYYQQAPKMLTPTSTLFAVSYAAAGSASIPLVLDEFKPSEMHQQTYDKFKLMLRDAYNCRNTERGGGNRENADYRAVHVTALSAPICFIAEAAESETALMERVVLLTLTKPPVVQAQEFYHKYAAAKRHKEVLGIIGGYMAAQIVQRYSLDLLREEFDEIYDQARKDLMLQAGEAASLSAEELKRKSGAKERTVYNYSVVKFGLIKLKNLICHIFPGEFDDVLNQMIAEVYSTVVEIQTQTVPEWLKVLNNLADMSQVDTMAQYYVKEGADYAIIEYNGKTCLELYARSYYMKYRMYAAASRTKPLFPNEAAFVHALNNLPAYEAMGLNERLSAPGGSHIFDLDELRGAGFISPE